MAELHILDSEFQHVKDTYQPHSEAVESFLTDYYLILDSIVDDKILEGKAADSLSSFAGLVRMVTEGQLTSVVQPHNISTELFLATLFDDDEAVI